MPILLFKVGSLVCPRGRSIDLLIQIDLHHLHQAKAQLKLGNHRLPVLGPVGPFATQPELEAPLTKRQLKRGGNKDSKLNKKFKNLEEEIDNLKPQMDSLKDKITKHPRAPMLDSRERRSEV